MTPVLRHILCLSVLFSSGLSSLFVNAEMTEALNGTYYLGVPERGAKQVLLQYGQLGEKRVIAVAACQKCPPAVYSFQAEPSQVLGVPVFMTAGLYLIRFDQESFILVQSDGALGRKIWDKIGHTNIYSKNVSKTQSVSRSTIQAFAIDLSKRMMSQETGKMAHGAGKYHLAVPQNHMGQAQSSYHLELITEPKKLIKVKRCDKCGFDEYSYLPEESEIAGIGVYRHATSYYLFDLKDGVLISTFSNAGGLGKSEWGENHHYNVLSNNLAYIRQILSSKQKQDLIDKMMKDYFASIKAEFEKRAQQAHQQQVADRQLPGIGLKNTELSDRALKAAKRWAKAWNWQEKLKATYFVNDDWGIVRNPLTGVVTGRKISGIVTMKHPDGRCRFQYVGYRQDHDGSEFVNLHMTGVGPIYDLKCDKI